MVDRTRFDFVRGLFKRLGYKGGDLDIRTRTFAATTSLWSFVNRRENRKLRHKHLAVVLDMLTAC